MLLDEKTRYTSPGVRQCLKILSWVSRNPEGMGFNDLRERVFNLPASTMTRHLKVMAEENWIKKSETGLYQPGPAYLCAVSNVTGRPNPDGMIRPVLDALAKDTGHSAAFVEWDRGGIRFRLKKEMPQSYCYPDSHDIMRDIFTHPFALTALAYLPDTLVDWNLETRPEDLSGSIEELKAELIQIKSQGFYEENFLCPRICAPILYGNGDLMGVIGISALVSSPGPEKILKAAHQIAAREFE